MLYEQLVVVFSILVISVASYEVRVTTNSPVLLGEALVLNATAYDKYGTPLKDPFCFSWRFGQLSRKTQDMVGRDTWVIPYDGRFQPGTMKGAVEVASQFLSLCGFSQTKEFRVKFTETIVGSMWLQQKNETITGRYLYTNVTTNHSIVPDPGQWAYVMSKATSVQVTWLVDCVNVSTSSNLSMNYTYAKDSSSSKIVAVIDANLVPPTTTTTTTTTTSTTTTSTTTTTTTTTTPSTPTTGAPSSLPENATISTSTTARPKLTKREAKVKDATELSTTTSGPLTASGCSSDLIRQEPGHVYGFFQKEIEVQTPISNVETVGNTWSKKGERIDLSVKCKGSAPLSYCLRVCHSNCNVTTNESCIFPTKIDKCEFKFSRYVYDEITMMLIIENDVSSTVTPVGIKIIVDPGNQGQLSVILVPVAFVLFTLTMVIYGIAYYVQNRRIAIVEVADFNFGDAGSDMDYKSFRQRLVESMNEMRQNRNGVPTDLTGDSTVGYGSMK